MKFTLFKDQRNVYIPSIHQTLRKKVVIAWKEYLDDLNSYPRERGKQKERAAVWDKEHLPAKLLEQMDTSLGYRFDPVQIRRVFYSREGPATGEFELQLLRRMVLEWLGGNRKISVSLVPKDEKAAKQGERFFSGVFGIIEAEKLIKVEVSPKQGAERGTTRHRETPRLAKVIECVIICRKRI